MKGRLNLIRGVAISLSIFLTGFIITLTLGQMDRVRTEEQLATFAKYELPSRAATGKVLDALLRMNALCDTSFDPTISARIHQLAQEAVAGVDQLVMSLPLGSPNYQAALRIQESVIAAARLCGTVGTSDTPASGAAAGRAGGHPASKIQASVAALIALDNQISERLQTEISSLSERSKVVRARLLWIFLASTSLALILALYVVRHAIVIPLRQARSELAREQNLLQVLMDNIPDFIYFKDCESRFVRINPALAELLGIDSPELAPGHTDFDYFSAEHAAAAYADERNIVGSGEPLVSKIELVSRPGLSRWVTSTKVPVKNSTGEVDLIVGVSRDVTAWKEAVDALEESEASFRLLFDSIPHAIWVYDSRTLGLVAFNHVAVEHYGYTASELRRLHLFDLHPTDEADRARHAAAQGVEQIAGAWRHLTKSGQLLDVEIVAHDFDFGGRRAVLVVAQDVSEKLRLQVELQQAQRLEAVAHLASGIAHEINTPIQYVGDNLGFLREAFSDYSSLLGKCSELAKNSELDECSGRDLRRRLEELLDTSDWSYLNGEVPNAITQSLDGVDRVSTIVRAMKTFAHPGQKTKAPADINKCVSDALVVARNAIKYVADVETEFGELPLVTCHISDLNQVFLNLLVNAADAIAEVNRQTNERGTIAVRTNVSGDEVLVSITDTGCGIPEEIRSRVFDPFFTTKEVGKGSGQGLAIARSILEKHGGSITFSPNGAKGTCFLIRLPVGVVEAPSTLSEAVATGGSGK